MTEIKEYKFGWGRSYRNSELAAGILSAVLAFVATMGDFDGPRVLVFFIFLLIGIVSILHYMYLTSNKTYVSITSDGINVASRYFKSKGRFIKWEKISRAQKNDRKKLLTLSLTDGDDSKIYLSSLNIDDRGDLFKIINEAIGMKPMSD